MSRKPCSKPGHVNRYRTGECIQCQHERNARYQAKRYSSTEGLPPARARAAREILHGLGHEDTRPGEVVVHSLPNEYMGFTDPLDGPETIQRDLKRRRAA